MKKCSKCKELKPLSEFNKNKYKKDGLASECRNCAHKNTDAWRFNHGPFKSSNKSSGSSFRKWYLNHKETAAENHKRWYEKNREKAIAYSRNWNMANPEKTRANRKKWEELHKGDEISVRNKLREYKKQYSRKWSKENRENRLEADRRYRARKKGSYGNITKEEWRAILDKYGHKCLYPGCDRTDLTMDHVKPLILGGTHTADNVQPLCLSHNCSKGRKHIDYR